MGYEFNLDMLNPVQRKITKQLQGVYKVTETAEPGEQVKPARPLGDSEYPHGDVSLTSFAATEKGFAEAGAKVGYDKITEEDFRKKTGVGGRAEFWLRPLDGKKKGYGPGARIELMPARKSMTPNQGQAVPGAGAGLEIRTKSSMAKLLIPGSYPIWQYMGTAEETITLVGAFAGFDIPSSMDENPAISQMSYDRRRLGNAWDEAINVLEQVKAGYELELVMRWNSDSDSLPEDLSLEFLPGLKYTGYVRNFRQERATAQRVYYFIEFVVTNRDHSILNEKADAPSLAPKTVRADKLVTASGSGATPAEIKAAEERQKKEQEERRGDTTLEVSKQDHNAKGVPIYVDDKPKGHIYVKYTEEKVHTFKTWPMHYTTKGLPIALQSASFDPVNGRATLVAAPGEESKGVGTVFYIEAAPRSIEGARENFIQTYIDPVFKAKGKAYKPTYTKISPPKAKATASNPNAPATPVPAKAPKAPVKPKTPTPTATSTSRELHAPGTMVNLEGGRIIVPAPDTYAVDRSTDVVPDPALLALIGGKGTTVNVWWVLPIIGKTLPGTSQYCYYIETETLYRRLPDNVTWIPHKNVSMNEFLRIFSIKVKAVNE
jgi:hypothetical protein